MKSHNHIVTALTVVSILASGCVPVKPPVQSTRVQLAQPRVPAIPLDAMTSQQRALLGIVEGQPPSKRALSTLHQTLMYNPDLMELYYPLGDRVVRATEIPSRQREILIMRVVWLYQDEYEWRRHYVNALKLGWTAKDIEQIKAGPESDHWQAPERLLLRAADQIVGNAFLEDDVWAGLREQYSVEDILVLITLVTHFHWVATISRSFGVEPDFPAQDFD